MRIPIWQLFAGAALLVSGCAGLAEDRLPTPLPPEYFPTAVALTVEAASVNDPAAETPAPGEPVSGVELSVLESPPASDLVLEPSPTLTPTESATATPVDVAALQTALAPPSSPVPDQPAGVQIFKPGALSRVISPIRVSAYFKPGARGRALVELYGETGKLLFREVKVFHTLPGASAHLWAELEFEIASAAEVGRLAISTRDEADRLIALNSVDLILLSMGEMDVNPASAIQESIRIQEPASKALIQGGTVRVSGIAWPDSDIPLRVELIDDEGRVVGQRLAGVAQPEEGGYGLFAVDVPYIVEAFTPVRLIVYEGGDKVSPMRHLASLEVLLGP